MNPDPLLLGVHVTLALGLTILLGTQRVELGRLRASSSAGREHSPASTNIMSVASIPVVTLVVMVTGGMLLGAGARGGPWVGAGVFSSVIIMASAIWALWCCGGPMGGHHGRPCSPPCSGVRRRSRWPRLS